VPKVQGAQNGSSSRGGRRSAARVSTSLSEINVVPLVDVMLVLLIIFMVAAPMMHRGVDVNLPVARRSAQISSERLFVTVPASYLRDHYVQLDDERVPIAVLNERIRQAMLTRQDKDVYLRGDNAITLQHLLEVMDKLREGGVEKVGIVAKLPGER
jgi:biopolymer transport protein ExbD